MILLSSSPHFFSFLLFPSAWGNQLLGGDLCFIARILKHPVVQMLMTKT